MSNAEELLQLYQKAQEKIAVSQEREKFLQEKLCSTEKQLEDASQRIHFVEHKLDVTETRLQKVRISKFTIRDSDQNRLKKGSNE